MLQHQKQILLIMLFVFTNIFSQDITYTVKHDGLETDNRIHQYKTPINKGLQKAVYNFVIKNLKKGNVIQIQNKNIEKTSAFQQGKKIAISKKQRFVTYKAINNSPLELKVQITKEAFIPLKVFSAIEFVVYERNQFMSIGFYCGFVVVILVVNLFYFFSFKDSIFLYYDLSVLAISIAVLINYGNFLEITKTGIIFIEAIDRLMLAFFGSLYAIHYIDGKRYYKNIYYWFMGFVGLSVITCIVYLVTDNFIWYVYLELVVFTILLLLWLTAVSLYKKNIYIKIFVIAYVFILIMGIDYYVLKLFNLNFLGIQVIHIKIGSFIEMIFLSYAVVYRMKTLKIENKQIHKDVYLHLQNIKELSLKLEASNNNEQNYLFSYDLSIREMEIAELIVSGKTNQQIADHLFISINTIKTHIRKIYEKLEVRNRKEVAIKLNT